MADSNTRAEPTHTRAAPPILPSRRVMVAQPQYLPRVSHMAMVDQADLLVLLDTVDVNRQSWQTRAQVRARDGSTVLLSVPVHAHMGQPLCEVQIDNTKPWQKKHWRTIEQAYSGTPGWEQVDVMAHMIHVSPWDTLSTMNHLLILHARRRLGITTPIVLASDLGPTRDGKVERIEDLLAATNATSYLASRGSTYLEGQSHIGAVPIEWFDYKHPVYQQGNHTEFVSHLSVIDLIAHSGTDSLNILRHNYALQCETSAQSARN